MNILQDAGSLMRGFGANQSDMQRSQAQQQQPQQCRVDGRASQHDNARAIDQYCRITNGNGYSAGEQQRFERCVEMWRSIVSNNGGRCTLAPNEDCKPAQYLPPVCPTPSAARPR